MHAKTIILSSILLITLIGGSCSKQNTDNPIQEDTLAAQQVGQQLFDMRCSFCHNGTMAKAPKIEALQGLTKESIVATLQTGVMRMQASMLTKEQHEQIATYLSQAGKQAREPESMTGRCEDSPPEALLSTSASIHDWGMGLENLRYIDNEELSIRRDNVAQLQLSWAFAFPNATRARSQPTLVGNTLFTASQHGVVYALDRKTGCIQWTFQADAEIRSAITIGVDENKQANRLYFADFHAQVYALDLATQELLWKRKVEEHPATTITGSMSLYEGRLYVPVSATEIISAMDTTYECCTFRGSVVAVDAGSGEQIWKTYTIAETPTQHGTNSIGIPRYAPSGAPVWSRPTIDKKRGVLYIGTGENYSRPASLTSDAIIAMSLEDGEIQWVHQSIPKDAWNGACSFPGHPNCPENTGPDADFGAPPMLVQAGDRDYLIAGQKSGALYALDPDQGGAVIWEKLVGRGGIMGGIHWGMATDGETLYIPINDRGNYSIHLEKEPVPGLHALKVEDGTNLWSTIEEDRCGEVGWTCGPGLSAAITATPEVIFAGALDGVLKAYDAQTGNELWGYDTKQSYEAINDVAALGGAIDSDGPVIVGKQLFINSGYGRFNQKQGNVLLAFELKEEE